MNLTVREQNLPPKPQKHVGAPMAMHHSSVLLFPRSTSLLTKFNMPQFFPKLGTWLQEKKENVLTEQVTTVTEEAPGQYTVETNQQEAIVPADEKMEVLPLS